MKFKAGVHNVDFEIIVKSIEDLHRDEMVDVRMDANIAKVYWDCCSEAEIDPKQREDGLWECRACIDEGSGEEKVWEELNPDCGSYSKSLFNSLNELLDNHLEDLMTAIKYVLSSQYVQVSLDNLENMEESGGSISLYDSITDRNRNRRFLVPIGAVKLKQLDERCCNDMEKAVHQKISCVFKEHY